MIFTILKIEIILCAFSRDIKFSTGNELPLYLFLPSLKGIKIKKIPLCERVLRAFRVYKMLILTLNNVL